MSAILRLYRGKNKPHDWTRLNRHFDHSDVVNDHIDCDLIWVCLCRQSNIFAVFSNVDHQCTPVGFDGRCLLHCCVYEHPSILEL